MIGRANWTIETGEGQMCLDTIRHDVELWNNNGQELGQIKVRAELWQERSRAVISRLVEEALKNRTLDRLESLARSMDDEDISAIVIALVLAETERKLETLERGVPMLEHCRKLAVVAIDAPGVTVHTAIGDPTHGYFLRRSRRAKLDETFSGKISSFDRAPAYGGQLEMEKGLGVLILRGLVNPSTAEPRVQLDIFSKS